MIRWSYVLPRVMIVAIAVLTIRFGLDPFLRWSLVRLGQRATSAKVEIGSLETSLARTEICLRDVQVADPDDPRKNLVEAREVKLGVDRGALAHRKYVVHEGRVSGLRFGGERATSGALDNPPDEKWDLGLDEGLSRLFEQWLDGWADVLQGKIVEEVEKLESVRLARELSQRWPAEYDAMEARAASLKARAEALRKLARDGTLQSSLRDLDAMRKTVQDVQSIQREAAQFRAELERLKEQALRDRQAVETAQKRDVETIRRRLRLDELQGGSLSDYLLGRELAEQVRTATQWARFAWKHWPGKAKEAEATRSRGVDILFAKVRPQPDWLIEKLAIDGEGSLDHKPFRYSGTMDGLTSHPAIYGQPATVKLDVRGPATLAIEAIFDRTQEAACDRISVECPALPQPQRVWGRPERLAVAVSPGNSRISLILHLRGEELLGRMTLRQEPVALAPSVAAAYGGAVLAADLQQALARVRSVEVVADLSGTLESPQCRLRSDLGVQLAEAMNWLVEQEVEARRKDLTVYVERRLGQELARFEQTLETKHQAMLAKLDLNIDEVRQLGELIGSRLPFTEKLEIPGKLTLPEKVAIPDKLFGRPLPVEIPRRY